MCRRVELPVDPLSPRRARQFVTQRLRSWGYYDLVPDAELLTSELVSNAVRYGRAPVVIAMADLGDGVVVSVQDADDALPVPGHPGDTGPTGGGLGVVQTVASAWGISPLPASGKFVWFMLISHQEIYARPSASGPATRRAATS